MKHGIHTDGRQCGPIDPARVAEQGWAWYDSAEKRDAAKPAPTAAELRAQMIVTPWQFRKALNRAGLRKQVEDALVDADEDARDGWEYATEFRRLDPLVVSMGHALGKSDAELDDLFALAATL